MGQVYNGTECAERKKVSNHSWAMYVLLFIAVVSDVSAWRDLRPSRAKSVPTECVVQREAEEVHMRVQY